jgi:CTP synthase (UTP-ammonia lyase)
MSVKFRVALVGDYKPSVTAHHAIPEALRLAVTDGRAVEGVWVATESICDPADDLAGYDGFWCVPASPYANMDGALGAIRYARESGHPFLGTCAGFQHAVIEYARNVCDLRDASHAETDPAARSVLITPLVCPLVEQSEEIVLQLGSLTKKGIRRDSHHGELSL